MQTVQETLVDRPPCDAPCAVLNADIAFLLCVAVWGLPDFACSDDLPSRWLDPQWQDRVNDARLKLGPHDPERALDLLRQSHRLQCRADMGRVHSTWWMRALQDESPAVRQSIARYWPNQLGAAATEEPCTKKEADERHNPDPTVAGWVLALATERLVGGEPVRYDEPPAIVALAALSSRDLYRLSHATGQFKTLLAGDPQGICLRPGTGRPAHCAGITINFSNLFGAKVEKAQAWANRDLDGLSGTDGQGRRRRLATLGLYTIARLLAGCEPYRVRWALQHVPYPVAKRIRSIMSAAPPMNQQVRRLEGLVLKTAWTRLTLENRLSVRHPDEAMRPDHAR